ncbi:MAG: hypothetical protein IT558_00285 [Alphaproteobacteria bacterium]|nr:hypothetical protein [Alphaproteobacteria bacterium]
MQPAIDAYYNKDFKHFGLSGPEKLTAEALYKDLKGYNYKNRPYTAEDVANDLARKIDFARANGMKVIAMDDKNYEDKRDANYVQKEQDFIKGILDQKGITRDALRKELNLTALEERDISPYIWFLDDTDIRRKYFTDQDVQKLDEFKNQSAIADRMAMDAGWAAHLKSAVPAGTKIAAIVGLDHPSNIIATDGIDEFLGGDDKAATIYLVQNSKVLQDDQAKKKPYNQAGLQPPADEPHAVIYTDNMKVEPRDKLDVEGYKKGDDIALQPSLRAEGNKPAMALAAAVP